MTKSTGVGRGGKRPGAGRPKSAPVRPPLPPAKLEEKKARDDAARQRTIKAFEDANSPAKAATVQTVEELAGSYTLLAVETLAEIALAGDKDAARVAAANALLNRAHGAPKGAAGKSKGDEADKPAPASDGWDNLLGAAN